MTSYQVVSAHFPAGWSPRSLEDAPPRIRVDRYIAEGLDFFEALSRARSFNAWGLRDSWAVVVQPDRPRSRQDVGLRLCTPAAYKTIEITPPRGWSPVASLDVPRDPWRHSCDVTANPQDDPTQENGPTLEQAIEQARSANQAFLEGWDRRHWTLVVAVENEPTQHAEIHDSTGLEVTHAVRRLHVVTQQVAERREEIPQGEGVH